jgi:hypothetical protein
MKQKNESSLRLLSLGGSIDLALILYVHSTVDLDGGGVQSISQLEIMRNIMQRIQYDTYPDDPDKTILPCEYFDLIGGSDTGGSVLQPETILHSLIHCRLLAIMFTKLYMSVDEAIDAFLQICEQVYSDDRVTAAQRSARLRECIEDMLAKKELPIDLKMTHHGSDRENCAW